MINIVKYKKLLIVNFEDNNNNDNDNNIQFTQEQLNFIIEKKVFLLYYRLNKLITNIPETITHLVIQNSKFNQDIRNCLPNQISHIEFNFSFNKSVNNLPFNLINIQFGAKFNQNVSNLPNKLKRLQFGQYFNQPIDMLPESLEMLIFAVNFNQDVSNLPSSIKYIRFGGKFAQPINNLPNSIQTIKFAISNYTYQHDILQLPTNLKILKLPWNYNSIKKINTLLPQCIEKIIINGNYFVVNDDFIDKISKKFNLDKTKIVMNNFYG